LGRGGLGSEEEVSLGHARVINGNHVAEGGGIANGVGRLAREMEVRVDGEGEGGQGVGGGRDLVTVTEPTYARGWGSSDLNGTLRLHYFGI
jgi:hypothetical protein